MIEQAVKHLQTRLAAFPMTPAQAQVSPLFNEDWPCEENEVPASPRNR